MTIVRQVLSDQQGNVTITILNSDTAPIRRASKTINVGEETTIEYEMQNLMKFWNLAGKSQLQME